jgi:integrase
VRLSDDHHVISQADGSVISPICVSQHWARTIRTTELAHLRFHDLRHAHATHLLAKGVHPLQIDGTDSEKENLIKSKGSDGGHDQN